MVTKQEPQVEMVPGESILKLNTINSMYANNMIEAKMGNGVKMKIPMSTLETILANYVFVAKKSPRQSYFYLVEAIPVDDFQDNDQVGGKDGTDN